ncbi:hypothetical protein FO059_18000 (plasmid) [Tomitella fengzijianii]|uniref:KfrA N-terminal DNA-binding domain-containing protein n=1 Tax=Tomitella fengzijianii TaxID=2597660 RepID=A0A516X8Z4_9ACTN|nr:hypothetical protein [Tomitella fengzijianii]QDQ99493.1 hypothetical protein FO059_18000 [Tomitella fengzijianii]
MASKAEQAAALADAFAALVGEGRPVTVRSLREKARVGTDAAREWLVRNRPAAEVPEVPADALVPVLGPLWSAAVTAARDELAETTAAERAALVGAEADALAEAATQRSRAEQAEAEVARLAAELDAAQTAVQEAGRRAVAAEKAAATAAEAEHAARERAHTAELNAADARATARTLRTILDSTRSDQDGN